MKNIATLALATVLTAALAGTSVAQTASPMVAPRSEAARLHPEALTAMVPRYLIAEFQSVESLVGNSATSILITNMSGRTCSYAVEFYDAKNLKVCTVRIRKVGPFETAYPCSRTMTNFVAASCAVASHNCNPALVFNAGKAIVYSSRAATCERMAVNATVINTSSDDTTIASIHTPKIVKYSVAERPRSNKGD
jgi:hypothetical protein